MRYTKFYGGILPDPKPDISEMNLTNEKILKFMNDVECPELMIESGSAVCEDEVLRNFMKGSGSVDVIEIGTFMGIGTTLLASYSRTVCTFDIWNRNAHHLWKMIGVDERINCFTGDQKFIDSVINELRYSGKFVFNMAFIDGNHTYKSVKHDFKIVKFCGRVLFHDMNLPEMRKFLDEIGGVMVKNSDGSDSIYGYWEK